MNKSTFFVIFVIFVSGCHHKNTGAGGANGEGGAGVGGAEIVIDGGLDGMGYDGSVCEGIVKIGPGNVPENSGGTTGADGGCCMGCLTPWGACYSETCSGGVSGDCGDTHACGHGGVGCVDCDDHNPCTDDECGYEKCVHYPYVYPTPCKTKGQDGFCVVDEPHWTGVCCPTGTCLGIDKLTGDSKCMDNCPNGQTCHSDGTCG